ncbi:MAG: GMC family oxidoreductase [Leptolyngbyaceae cyanobacterium RM1_1_2]|nr:GMC family oxidoreductase [Leptolyngbyaceae cyanobacterium RM1_1_2]
MSAEHYDLIVIGTGAGGGTLVHRLAATGKKILILERGSFLPREKENWSPKEVYQKERYHTREVWHDLKGNPFRPGIGYWVGGNTKVYGAALLRMRQKDFDAVTHHGGISPAWPLKYDDFEPYYTAAEKLYNVHGLAGEDPIEPPMSQGYPHSPVSHEPRMQTLCDGFLHQGLHPFHLPLGIKLDETHPELSACIRCSTCDGYPCLVQAKADADVNAVRPAQQQANVTLMTKAKVVRLHTSPSGREVSQVEVEIEGRSQLFSADIVVVACGAINSALLLLRSASDQHPNGLANSSDQVGRNFMKHLATAILALSTKPNPAVYQKTIAINDFYWGEPDFPYPMGQVQNTGNVLGDMIPAETPPALAPLVKLVPGFGLERIASHSTGWWLQSEDLPAPDNRVRLMGEQVCLEYQLNNTQPHERLAHRWMEVLKAVDHSMQPYLIPMGIYPRNSIPLQAVGHQCGTCRFGEDPVTSVLDLNCRTHEVDNLYVVDSSFFPSNSGVNPTLTIMANALRVAEHLQARMQ